MFTFLMNCKDKVESRIYFSEILFKSVISF